MSTSTLEIDLEALEQAAEEENDFASQVVDLVESDDDVSLFQYDHDTETVTRYEEPEQGSCGCESKEDELRQRLDEVKTERDELQTLVDAIKAEQQEQAAKRIRAVNEKLPEDEQYTDDELEELVEAGSVKSLNQTADMLERVSSFTENVVQEGPENLGGASQKPETEEEYEQAAQQVDDVAKQMFGKSFEQINEEIESDEWGR